MTRAAAQVAVAVLLAGVPSLIAAQEHQHEHPPAGAPTPEPSPPAGASGHTGQAAVPSPSPAKQTLFQSDMTLMAGMRPVDPMGGMAMPHWQWMTMGTARLTYNHQGGLSGAQKVESGNWVMGMGQRDVGPGRLTLMLMSSLEAATLHEGGSPQLFQTGETFEGRPLVDAQHPHDLFMNLSATWRLPLGADGGAWLNAALRGEPALGPTTYMHRASAGENPAAVLGHHFQDSTHITDDVITLGAGWRRVGVEGSLFHGKEPDEGRWDLDPGALDSWSARVKLDLGAGWTGQVSHGVLNEPEALNPGDVKRTTASLHYGERGDRPFAASFVWGRNRESHGTFEGFLVEGAWQASPVDHLYARGEQVDRDLDLLVFKGRPPVLRVTVEEGGRNLDRRTTVRALTLGYLRDVLRLQDAGGLGAVNVGLAADLTLYDFESLLDATYGESPVSVHAFLRVRWGSGHGAHGHR